MLLSLTKTNKKQEKHENIMKYELDALIRYILCFIPISLFTLILTPITVYGSSLLLFFYNPETSGIVMTIKDIAFVFIEACIASYAYWLIMALTLTTKNIIWKTRIKMIFTGFILILIMNYLRIIVLVIARINATIQTYDIIHTFFWKFLSGVYVAIVWIILIKIYKIEKIPVYDDLKYLYKKSFLKK